MRTPLQSRIEGECLKQKPEVVVHEIQAGAITLIKDDNNIPAALRRRRLTIRPAIIPSDHFIPEWLASYRIVKMLRDFGNYQLGKCCGMYSSSDYFVGNVMLGSHAQ
jgi:hypothetical protein